MLILPTIIITITLAIIAACALLAWSQALRWLFSDDSEPFDDLREERSKRKL